MWMMFNATYTVWNSTKKKTYKRSEKSFADFMTELEREVDKTDDVIQHINIENEGCV